MHLYLEKYSKPSEQLFPNRRPLCYENVHKVQTAQKSTQKRQKIGLQQKYRLGTISNIKLRCDSNRMAL